MTAAPMTTAVASVFVGDPNHGADSIDLPRERTLTSAELHAVVSRNSVGCVHQTLADGAARTTRVRYVHDGNALYIPAWVPVDGWYEAPPPALEYDVSEVDWRSSWRYVRLRGPATPLQPTGASREREAWRQAVAILRRMIANMAPTDALAVANFAIVRMDIECWDGAAVPWAETGAFVAPATRDQLVTAAASARD